MMITGGITWVGFIALGGVSKSLVIVSGHCLAGQSLDVQAGWPSMYRSTSFCPPSPFSMSTTRSNFPF